MEGRKEGSHEGLPSAVWGDPELTFDPNSDSYLSGDDCMM